MHYKDILEMILVLKNTQYSKPTVGSKLGINIKACNIDLS